MLSLTHYTYKRNIKETIRDKLFGTLGDGMAYNYRKNNFTRNNDFGNRNNRYSKRRRGVKSKPAVIAAILIGVLALAVAAYFIFFNGSPAPNQPGVSQPAVSVSPGSTATPAEPTPTPTPEIPDPHAVDGTRPSDFGLQTEMELGGSPVDSYSRAKPIFFGEGGSYTDAEGIITFRGNNFRDSASYGTIGQNITGQLQIEWQTNLPESIKRVNSDRTWAGSGWTGQPLIVKWDKDALANMNILDSKKSEDGLTEVILGTEGAKVYFVDLKDGKPTRDKISSPWCLKGAGALDPRGYPLYFVGAGDKSSAGHGENMIFSLTNSEKLYDYGEDDPFSNRNWWAYDASTIVSAATDTVTYASETGIIYQYTLNTQYDAQAGTISVNPSDIFKWKYTTDRSRAAYTSKDDPTDNKPYLGFETSPVFWRQYMYVADNGGNLFCINVNTFEVVWMCDTLDDTNCSPVFELDKENGRAYIYIGTSSRVTRDSNDIAHIPFWKIDAITGEKVWTGTDKNGIEGYDCIRPSDSGGIQDTAALGKNQLKDLVYVTYANVVDENKKNTGSWLVAYDKATGREVWKQNFPGQCWSSPVDVYDDNGKGYIVFGTATYKNSDDETVGSMALLDGLTGEILSSVEIKGQVEASPAVFNNMIVIGTRGQMLYGIKIS